MEKPKSLTYKQKASNSDIARYAKAVALPLGILLLSLFTVSRFALFGTNIIAPLTGAMWTIGSICAIALPSHRQTILKEMHTTIAIYLISLTVLKELIALVSGVSSEMLMEAFGQAIPLTSGNTISSFLQNILWITAVMTPFGFVMMEGKKLYTFKRKNNPTKVLAQLRNIRNDNHTHTQ